MRKYILGITLLLLVSTSTLAQEANAVTTRFGVLKVSDEGVLLFKGAPVRPPIEANNSLDLGEAIRIGGSDVVLVTDNGGTACPATHYFVAVTKAGVKVSPPFGTCSDLVKVKQNGSSIAVSMPGFQGPFSSKRAQSRAARETHVFIYRAGIVTENGKVVK